MKNYANQAISPSKRLAQIIRRIRQSYDLIITYKLACQIKHEQTRYVNLLTELRPWRFNYKYLSKYLSLEFSTTKRAEILLYHYRFLNGYSKSIIPDNCKRAKSIKLNSTHPLNKHAVFIEIAEETFLEGDLALNYTYNDTLLYTMSFSIASGRDFAVNENAVIFIGGSQGVINTAKIVRVAAKENCEISQASTLFIALQAFAKCIGINTIIGIPASVHTSRGVSLQPTNHLTTYDNFWELNGGMRKNNYYIMRNTPYLKNILLVKQRHRSRARKKQLVKLALWNFFMQTFQSTISCN